MTARVPTSIATVLDDALQRDPNHEAVVARSGRLSYAELDRRANQSARALAELGVGPGDRVAVSLPNDLDIVTAFHGAMRLGAIWVGINRALAPPEVDYILRDTSASLVIVDDDSHVASPDRVARRAWVALVDHQDTAAVSNDIDAFAPAAIAYTSGTTGRPKGVVHSQRSLLVPGAATVASRYYGPDLRKGDCLPLTILNLLALTTLLVAQAGGTCVIMDRIDADGVAAWIRDERVTAWNGVPAILYDMVHGSTVPADLVSLDDLWSGGADCPESLQTAFAERFGVALRTTYGLTEAPSLVAIDPRGGPHVIGASGVPLPHLALEVLEHPGTEQRLVARLVGQRQRLALVAGHRGTLLLQCLHRQAQGHRSGPGHPVVTRIGPVPRPDRVLQQRHPERAGQLGGHRPGGLVVRVGVGPPRRCQHGHRAPAL